MFLVPTTPTRNFVEYDRILRQIMVSDAVDRLAQEEANERIFGRTKYRGPTVDFLSTYEKSHPLHQPSAEIAAH